MDRTAPPRPAPPRPAPPRPAPPRPAPPRPAPPRPAPPHPTLRHATCPGGGNATDDHGACDCGADAVFKRGSLDTCVPCTGDYYWSNGIECKPCPAGSTGYHPVRDRCRCTNGAPFTYVPPYNAKGCGEGGGGVAMRGLQGHQGGKVWVQVWAARRADTLCLALPGAPVNPPRAHAPPPLMGAACCTGTPARPCASPPGTPCNTTSQYLRYAYGTESCGDCPRGLTLGSTSPFSDTCGEQAPAQEPGSRAVPKESAAAGPW
jgi:hypothetical protein